MEEQRRQHEQMLLSFESKARDSFDGKEQQQKKIDQLKEIHDAEVRKLKEDLEANEKRLGGENASLTNRLQELELEYNCTKNDMTKEIDQLKGQLEEVDSQKQRALTQNKAFDSQKAKMMEEIENRHKT